MFFFLFVLSPKIRFFPCFDINPTSNSGRGGAFAGYDQPYQYGQWSQPGAGGYSQTGGYPSYGQPTYGQPNYYGSDGTWNPSYYQGYGQPYQSYTSASYPMNHM